MFSLQSICDFQASTKPPDPSVTERLALPRSRNRGMIRTDFSPLSPISSDCDHPKPSRFEPQAVQEDKKGERVRLLPAAKASRSLARGIWLGAWPPRPSASPPTQLDMANPAEAADSATS